MIKRKLSLSPYFLTAFPIISYCSKSVSFRGNGIEKFVGESVMQYGDLVGLKVVKGEGRVCIIDGNSEHVAHVRR